MDRFFCLLSKNKSVFSFKNRSGPAKPTISVALGVNICVKFHENMSSGFKVMEKTQKLFRETHTQKKKENYIPHCRHTWYGI